MTFFFARGIGPRGSCSLFCRSGRRSGSWPNWRSAKSIFGKIIHGGLWVVCLWRRPFFFTDAARGPISDKDESGGRKHCEQIHLQGPRGRGAKTKV
jgi:hypothetical protein